MIPSNRPPTSPGEMLQEEFMIPMGLSQTELARRIGDSTPKRINEIINGRRSISADMAVRLSRVFDNSAEFWMNLQNAVDLYKAREDIAAAAAR